MKRLFLVAAALLTTAAISAPAIADVGVSVNIGQPNFFGRIDVGDAPPPQVVYREPIIIERRAVVEEPVYLRVPVREQKNWRRYCNHYGACGQRVYFVQDRWYNDVYVPHYRERHDNHNYSDDHRDHQAYRRDHDYSDDKADHREERLNHDYSDDKADHREERANHDYSDDKADHARTRAVQNGSPR